MEEIPEGYVRIRKLNPDKGDEIKIVKAEDVMVEISDAELIIDEETNELIDSGELEGKIKAGKVKKVRTLPHITGGSDGR